jgi:hypothetical protein
VRSPVRWGRKVSPSQPGGQRAAGAVQDDAGAHAHHAHAQLGGGLGLALPGHADLGEEALAGRICLDDLLVAARPVVAAGRARDERPRPLRRRQRAQPGHEVAGAQLAAGADALAGRRAPALGDVLAGQVDDRVATPEGIRGGGPGGGIPARAPPWVARQDRDVVAALAQALHEPRADQAGCARDGDPHDGPTSGAERPDRRRSDGRR